MTFESELKAEFEQLENATVSDSFGGAPARGKADAYSVEKIFEKLEGLTSDYPTSRFTPLANQLKKQTTIAEYKSICKALVRFSFLIELTNLSITSTKMKTRWVEGKITKTDTTTFQNIEGSFTPGNDERASDFDRCFEIFLKTMKLVSETHSHLGIAKALSKTNARSVPYETVFTYANSTLDPKHVADNVILADVSIISWLIATRPIFQEVLNPKNRSKISTKCYKTDRSQTGEVQTNRAKRWECLSFDFQHASLEDCWSVEKKLYEGLVGFEDFPEEPKAKLIEHNLISPDHEITRCPITRFPLSFKDFQSGPTHGESKFQVGHLDPLKAGGTHSGSNTAWISDDGNRIQGSLSLAETISLIKQIAVNHGVAL